MSYSALILLLLAFSPLMANGKPANITESNEPVSRESRQMMLPAAPYYYIPYPQVHRQPAPSIFQSLDDIIRMLDPATKQRLLTSLMTLAESFSSNQPFDETGFKSQTNSPDGLSPVDLSSFLDENGQLPIEFQNASPEEIKEMVENRLGFGAIANIAVQYIVQMLIQMIIAQIIAALG
ncbi:uncharacterized protein LOC124326573 [Daphnia pulicaria]|uniref:uncharacterized protein LOC124326573 n=1 Tax=Daphnia pulicaria TaxID=35523 RepID=UPI001EEB458B|nr:uncharacterized protein LOC124326573 [Daphnia pulicaria]